LTETREVYLSLFGLRAGPSGPGKGHQSLTLTPFTQARVPYPQPSVMSRREDEEDIEAGERDPLAGEHNDSPAPPPRYVRLRCHRRGMQTSVLTECATDQHVRFML
jgi:hypothetical protein